MKLESDNLMKEANVKGEIVLTPEQIRKIQEINLQTCKDIQSFCKKHHLTVYLGGGTALGGIRHHGFIPWDEDVDLNMTRMDFEYFAKHFLEEYGDKYYFRSNFKMNDYSRASFLNVVKYDTVYRKPLDPPDEPMGIWVDIWIIENMYNNAFLRKLHGAGFYFTLGLLSCKYYNKNWNIVSGYYEGNNKLMRILKLKKLLGYFLFFISENRLAKWQTAWCRICKNNNSKFVSIPQGRKKFFGEMFKRYPYLNPITVDFEGTEFQISEDYDTYLTRMYGKNYMQVPPENKRERHPVIELKFGK